MAETFGWQPDTFSFSPEFQKQIIATMIQEPKLFERLGLLTDSAFFEIRNLSIIFKALQDFYEEYRGLPTKEALGEYISSPSDNILETIEELYTKSNIDSSTIEFIEESVRNFISCQAIKKAVYESLDDLGDINKHLNVKERIEAALIVGASLDDLGTDIYDEDVIIDRLTRRANNTEIKKISSGWSWFDDVFGGLGIGELFTFMGPANCGKSMYLVNIGANCLLQKLNVLHITLEMSPESCAERYDSRLLGLNREELKSNKANAKIKELLNKRIGKIVIKEFPAGTASSADIGTFMRRLENTKKFKTDVLVLDYADILRSSKQYNDRRFELDTIYMELRNIAIEYKIPVVTGTQLNRSSLSLLESGGILTSANISESYGIQRIIDSAVTINATPTDTLNNTSVLYVAKNRTGRAGETCRMYTDFTKSLIREWSADSVLPKKK